CSSDPTSRNGPRRPRVPAQHPVFPAVTPGGGIMKRMVESRRRLTLRALFTGLAGGCFAALTLSACMSLAGGSSSTETGDKVALNGRVTGGAGDGIAGVVVTLKGSALADTTDITGHFARSRRRPA